MQFKESLYVTGNSGHYANGKSGQCEHWNRLPDSVLYDRELSMTARCVCAVPAGAAHQGTLAKMGQRRISKLLGVHQETVGRALQELSEQEHISIRGKGNCRRAYHLHSDVFGQKQRAGVEEKPDAASGQHEDGMRGATFGRGCATLGARSPGRCEVERVVQERGSARPWREFAQKPGKPAAAGAGRAK